MVGLFLATALGAGCGGECREMACMGEALSAAWPGGMEAVGTLLERIEDPLERAVLVDELVEEHPEAATWLCALLGEGQGRERCHQVHSRPHMLAGEGRQGPEATQIMGRSAPGLANSLFDAVGTRAECPEGMSLASCQTRAARSAAVEEGVERAASFCMVLEEGRWRHECMFQAAEAWSQQGGQGASPEGVALCVAAGPFSDECLTHAIMHLVRSGDGPGWSGTVNDAAALQAAWEEWNAAFGAQLVDRFWSELLASSFANGEAWRGPPLDLPEAARPHVHAAAAMRFFLDTRLAGGELSDLGEASRRLADQIESGGPPPRRLGEPFGRITDLWADSEERGVAYLGNSRRAMARDSTVDLALCLLEAAARVVPPDLALIRGAREHPKEVVRRAAIRLEAALEETGEAGGRGRGPGGPKP